MLTKYLVLGVRTYSLRLQIISLAKRHLRCALGVDLGCTFVRLCARDGFWKLRF